MTRRWWLAAAPALCACGEKAEFPPDLFPARAGGWNLVDVRDASVSEVPDPVPRNSVDRLRAATYKQGDGEIQARVYRLSSTGAGAALAAGFRPSANTVFFNHGLYFVVVKWQAADRKSLREFVADLQKRLGAVDRVSSR